MKQKDCTWITIPKAAKMLQMNRRTIQRWVHDGRFKTDEVRELPNRRTVICLEAILRPRRKRKRTSAK